MAPGAELAILPPTINLQPSTLVGGRYEIREVVSYGAMGIIYRVRHRTLGIDLALKAMRPELATEESYDRFAEEARNAALLKSEHVARVFDFGRLPSGELYLVMELLDGEDLATVLARSGPLPVDLTVELALQACEALSEAHALGIIHRDLKPENLFLTETANGEPLLKIVDFGVSKRVVGPRRIATVAGTVGSPHYMAPEQLRSARDIDQRADVWGFGAVLYELFAGRPAFSGDTLAEVCASVLTERPAPLVRVRPEVGPELSRIVDRCLAPNRDARFQSMAEVAQALRAATAPPPIRASLPSADLDVEAIGPIPGVRRHRFLSVFLTLLACVALLLAVACASLGPARTLELGRQFAVSALLGGAREHRVPQPEVARALRVAVTKQAAPVVSPSELPELDPVPRARPRPKRAKVAPPIPAAPEPAKAPAEASAAAPLTHTEPSASPESAPPSTAIASAENPVAPERGSAE